MLSCLQASFNHATLFLVMYENSSKSFGIPLHSFVVSGRCTRLRSGESLSVLLQQLVPCLYLLVGVFALRTMFDGKIALEDLLGVERLELDLEAGNKAYVFIGTNGVSIV